MVVVFRVFLVARLFDGGDGGSVEMVWCNCQVFG